MLKRYINSRYFILLYFRSPERIRFPELVPGNSRTQDSRIFVPKNFKFRVSGWELTFYEGIALTCSEATFSFATTGSSVGWKA